MEFTSHNSIEIVFGPMHTCCKVIKKATPIFKLQLDFSVYEILAFYKYREKNIFNQPSPAASWDSLYGHHTGHSYVNPLSFRKIPSHSLFILNNENDLERSRSGRLFDTVMSHKISPATFHTHKN